MISDMRAKDEYSVKLHGCGKFTLAEDLSDISDMTRIDLSSIKSLEGEPLEKFSGGFFCAPVRTLKNFPDHSRTARNTNAPRTNRQHPGARELPEPDQRELRQLRED